MRTEEVKNFYRKFGKCLSYLLRVDFSFPEKKALERMVKKGLANNEEEARNFLNNLEGKELYHSNHGYLKLIRLNLPKTGVVYSFGSYNNTIVC